jgi:hypothetical protein
MTETTRSAAIPSHFSGELGFGTHLRWIVGWFSTCSPKRYATPDTVGDSGEAEVTIY